MTAADAFPAAEPTYAEIRDALDALPPGEAAARVEHAMSLAIQRREFEAVPNLLHILLRYDPHRAGRIYELLAEGTVRVPVSMLREVRRG